MSLKPNVIVISGPTATGKSSLAVQLIKRLRLEKVCDSEIINADSVQVYKGFDIGACKPSIECLSAVPHHLMSYCEGHEPFNAGAFCDRARKLVYDINARGSVPFVVGGTGLYIRSLLCGIANVPVITNEAKKLVSNYEEQLRVNGADEKLLRQQMHKWLSEYDKCLADRLHENDIVRIRRALLVVLSSRAELCGQSSFDSFCDIQDAHAHGDRPFRALVLVLMPSRDVLYANINKRVDEMLELGLVSEVKSLRKLFSRDIKPFGAIGYRHACDYLDGVVDYCKMVELIKRDTRRYAKRQVTWWSNQPKSLGWDNIGELQCDVAYTGGVCNLAVSTSKLVFDFLSGNLTGRCSDICVFYVDNIYL